MSRYDWGRFERGPRAKFDLDIVKPQTFSLPRSIVVYFTKNPSTLKIYKKLRKSCKYFYLTNPIIIPEYLGFQNEQWLAVTNCNAFRQLSVRLNLKDTKFKIWLEWQLSVVRTPNPKMISELIPRIYRSEISIVILMKQILSIDELISLNQSQTLRHATFIGTLIKYENGDVVPLEKLIESLPKLEKFKL